MLNIDYARHNDEVRELLEQEAQGTPSRVRMTISCNPRLILSDPAHNPQGISFEQYINDPQTMLEIQCRFQEYCSDDLIWDKPMGFSNLEGIPVYPDMQNVLEPSYFGCEVAYHGCHEPGTKVLLDDESKYAFVDRPFPDPFAGLFGKAFDCMAYFREQRDKGFTYKGKPIGTISGTGEWTDGPFTLACCLLGATEMCIALYEEPDFAEALLTYITEATIVRTKAVRQALGIPVLSAQYSFADDSIAMLSEADYRRFVLPCHQRLIRELTTDGTRNAIHLCGNASHLFPTIHEELHVFSYDTGFPIRHGELVQRLGPEVTVMGGVHVDILSAGTPDEIQQEARRILEEVKPHTRRFILKEANNLSPGTPPENVLAMYEAVKQYGRYDT